MRLLLAVGLISLFMCCKSSTREVEVVQYYPSGEVLRTHTEVNGLKEGKMTEFNKDGSLRYERYFEKDLQVGRSVYYLDGNTIKEVQHHVAGQKQGIDSLFYPDGSLQSTREYAQGKLNGYLRKWDAAGTLIYEARFSNDSLVEVKGELIDRAVD